MVRWYDGIDGMMVWNHQCLNHHGSFRIPEDELIDFEDERRKRKKKRDGEKLEAAWRVRRVFRFSGFLFPLSYHHLSFPK